jgi:hypothetical protein
MAMKHCFDSDDRVHPRDRLQFVENYLRRCREADKGTWTKHELIAAVVESVILSSNTTECGTGS